MAAGLTGERSINARDRLRVVGFQRASADGLQARLSACVGAQLGACWLGELLGPRDAGLLTNLGPALTPRAFTSSAHVAWQRVGGHRTLGSAGLAGFWRALWACAIGATALAWSFGAPLTLCTFRSLVGASRTQLFASCGKPLTGCLASRRLRLLVAACRTNGGVSFARSGADASPHVGCCALGRRAARGNQGDDQGRAVLT
jgi:hypothetical protein